LASLGHPSKFQGVLRLGFVTAATSDEIQRLQLLERCRKRAPDEPTHSLRQIFDTETHSTGNAAAASIAFADVESSMYKRRRLQLPTLPADANDVVPRIRGTLFELCDGQQFFRGTVNTSARCVL